MKDEVIKQKLENLQIPQPDLGFEERIIAKAMASGSKSKVFPFVRTPGGNAVANDNFILKRVAVAACLAVILFATLTTRNTPDSAGDYASLFAENEFYSDADIYDDIILAGNF